MLVPVLFVAVLLLPGVHSGSAGAVTADRVLVASGLDYPAMFAVAPDRSLIVAERRTGAVVRVDLVTGLRQTLTVVPGVCTAADQGLFGVAVSPAWPTVRAVWAYATRLVGGACANQVLRITPRGKLKVLHSEAYTGEHIGGKVAFGPDGYLYVSTGEGGNNTPYAQDLSSGKGKVLRFRPGGKPAGAVGGRRSAVFAYGFRNVFGFDFDPATGALWVADNGPDCNDELDLVSPGGNYGWGPNGTCSSPPDPPANTNQDGPSPIQPALSWSPSSGPTGATFCDRCDLDLDGALLFGTYNAYVTGDIWAATLGLDRRTVLGRVSIAQPSPPPLAVESAPGGPVYYSDAKGSIWRVTPVG